MQVLEKLDFPFETTIRLVEHRSASTTMSTPYDPLAPKFDASEPIKTRGSKYIKYVLENQSYKVRPPFCFFLPFFVFSRMPANNGSVFLAAL